MEKMMSEFRQLCPFCKRTLELPVTAIGQVAQCPVCNTTFTAGKQPETADQPVTAGEIQAPETEIASGPSLRESQAESQTDLKVDLTSTGLAEDSIAETATEQITDAAISTAVPTTLDPAGNESTAAITTTSPASSESDQTKLPKTEPNETPTESVPAASFPEYPEGVNPFSVPLPQASPGSQFETPYLSPLVISSGNFARPGEVIIVSQSIGEILKATVAILLSRGITLMVSFLCILFTIAVTTVIGMICMGLISPFVTVVANEAVVFTFSFFVTTLAVVVSCRNTIAIARNTPNLMTASLPKFRSVLPTLVPIVLLSVVASLFRWTLFSDYRADSLVLILTGYCAVVTCGWLWSSIFLCCDMQSSGPGSVLVALRMLYHNKLTTALLILISTLLTTCGVISCQILLLVTLPFTQMMLAIAYLMMTNQPLADPRHPIEAD